MPNDLRAVWPNLSNDEKNALVAMGMGCRLLGIVSDLTGEMFPWVCGPDDRAEGEDLGWSYVRDGVEVWDLPDFCGSWEGFGRIWEACRDRGLNVWAHGWSHEHHRINVCSVLGGRWLKGEATASDVRDGFAMAFVLASGVEVPEEWVGVRS